jgi:cysteine-rich repeat protein
MWFTSGCGLVVGCNDDPPIDMFDGGGFDASRTDAPRMDAPGTDAPGVDAPGVDAPGVDAPGVDAPGVDAPGVDAPGVDGGVDGGTDTGPGTTCGDRRIELPEECDDGNTTDGDGCDHNCRLEVSASCGDGVVDYTLGEECDDNNRRNGDGCSSACRIEASASCGDGVLDLMAGEQCDDGGVLPGDGCSPTCQYETVGAFCGNDLRDPLEVCDDGNLRNGDSCNPTCNFQNRTEAWVGDGTSGSRDGVGTAARIGGFGSLAADDTYVWFGDSANRVLRRIEVATATVLTIAGNGTAAIVDNRDGANASFTSLEAVTTDGATVWVANGSTLRAVSTTAPFGVGTVAGGTRCTNASCYFDGVGAAARFDDIRGATYYGGYVWVLDANAAVLRRFDPATNTVLTVAGSPYMNTATDGIGTAARFVSPRYMATDNSGMLYIADTNGATIRAYNTVTGEVTTFAGNGTATYLDGVGTAAGIHRPRGMTSDGTSIYWVEFNQHTLRQGVIATQQVSTMIGRAGSNGYVEGTGNAARMASPFSVTFHWPSGSLFLLDSGNQRIRRIQ